MTGSIPPSDRETTAVDAPREPSPTEVQCRFASDAAHELCTPVAALRVELEEARLHPEQTDLCELLDRALGNVDRLQTIVTDLLTLARAQSTAPIDRQRFDLAHLVGLEVLSYGNRYGTPVLLVTGGDAGVVVDADRFQVRRVVAILVDNAYRHAKSSIRVEVRWDGEAAELSVTDDGGGVAAADRERIFEPFARLDAARDRRKGGAGLGLSIAREIIRAHGGTLEVDGTASGGARFVARLPAVGPAAEEQCSECPETARLAPPSQKWISARPEPGPANRLERGLEDLLGARVRSRWGFRCTMPVRRKRERPTVRRSSTEDMLSAG
ncbi:hypothetical protein GCM10023194_79850 [Planotetraspora phitsanulokensis]|uniref:histidine kinase n=1 Tax=Planotetraspora phitsanulokensis TaxID=575192 RepID=A0A8J3UE80_9ACTN|nr:HAMP domain-containing sensor histidine kinase [Planotetraspora phitsanulokensis]GII41686.1 hypothetical protein Pph01_66890 [Planotetraspora phitsanulokensis]